MHSTNRIMMRMTRIKAGQRMATIILALCLAMLYLFLPAHNVSGGDGSVFYPGASIRFDHLTIDNGLSQNSIQSLLQDDQGFIWIGTQDGLNRFDGYTFTKYKNDPSDPESISDNNISAIYQDPDGSLWVGTNGGGLDRLDPKSGRFERFLPDPTKPSSLADANITTIVPGKNGQLWIGTLDGLELLDKATGRFTHFRSNESNPATLSSDAISTILPSEDGTIWIGTGANGAIGGGLNRLDPATGIVQRFGPSGQCLQSPNISSILIDPVGSLWIGHGGAGLPGGGLDYYNPLTNACRHYDSLSTNGVFANDNIIRMMFDRDMRLWITFWGGGIDYMEPGIMGAFYSIHHDPFDPESLSSDNAAAILQDKTGVIWVGTSDAGLNLLNLENLQFRVYQHNPGIPASLASNSINGFAETPDGRIWIASQDAGLALFEPSMGMFTYFRNIPSDPGSLSSNRIMSLFADSDGSLWVGTVNAGLNHFDPKTGKSIRYFHDSAKPDSLIDDEVTYITRDNAGTLWVATMGGLSRLDPDHQDFVNYSGLSGAPVTLMTDGGDLWIGTWGGGINRLRLALPGILPPDAARLSIMDTFIHDAANPNSPSENNVWAIQKTSDGTLWFGTSSGLNRYNPDTGKFTVFSEENGLRNDSVACMLDDPQGYLWITTANGLARFDPKMQTFTTFDKSNGLQGSGFNPNACFRSPETGDIYVGGTDGFTVFNPEKISRNTTPPNVVITSFKVFNQPVDYVQSGRNSVQLKYSQNTISFEFAALDFHSTGKNVYSYQLKGFDKGWSQAGTSHSAEYTNLPSGNYTFQVKAANNDGTWSTVKASLQLQIVPPLWLRWQFQLAAGLVLALAVVGGFQWRLMASRANARSLERRIAERTVELNQANEQLREKATQDAVAAERSRLARDLHDAVTQTLFSATLIAEVLPQIWENNRSEGDRRLEELRLLTRGALAEMRTLLVELRPNALSEVPLTTLLRQLSDALIGRTRLDIQLKCRGEKKLPSDVQVGLYRIAQESLNNIVKHAHATQVIIDLDMGEPIQLSVADNGVGFDPAMVLPDHIGLRIMRERAEAIKARFSIESASGKGTCICVKWSNPVD